MYEIPRESVEYIYPQVTVNGEVVTTGVQFSVVKVDQRPDTWVNAVIVEGKTAYLVTGLEPGSYRAYSRVNGDAPQTPVQDNATFRIT